jgi:hypothetical protein
MTELKPLNELANLIKIECTGKTWYAYAKPYVEAMATLDNAKQNYYEDSGVSVCLYALSNLSSWRGETARTVKAQIKRHTELALAK